MMQNDTELALAPASGVRVEVARAISFACENMASIYRPSENTGFN